MFSSWSCKQGNAVISMPPQDSFMTIRSDDTAKSQRAPKMNRKEQLQFGKHHETTQPTLCSASNHTLPEDTAAKVKATRLVPVNIQFDTVTVADSFGEPIQTIVRRECDVVKASILVVYAIRHPACGACRDKGRDLANLSNRRDDVTLITTIKETEGLEESLMEYSAKYGQGYPIYKDKEWTLYDSLGMKRLSLWDMARGITKTTARARAKGITPNLAQVRKGDLLTKGGVFIFDCMGSLFRAIPEPDFGEALDMDAVEAAIEQYHGFLQQRASMRRRQQRQGQLPIEQRIANACAA